MTDPKTRKPAARTAKSFDGFTAEERAAMKDHASELKTSVRRGSKATRADGAADVLAKIAGMDEADRALAEQVHGILTGAAPGLWYGMPAYATAAGKIVCHFQPAVKFKTRYATIGFSDQAQLDDGTMWPVACALTELTAADAKRIAAIVAQAAG